MDDIEKQKTNLNENTNEFYLDRKIRDYMKLYYISFKKVYMVSARDLVYIRSTKKLDQ